MSPETAEEVASHMEKMTQAAREIGVLLENPFLTLSFMALPVIPELKLTDKGLVDVAQFRIIPLEAN
jgi:adenine deaminase